MNVSGISPLAGSQVADRGAESRSEQDGGSATGWKYLTVKEGNVIYTYIVIGKDMRVLIGKSPAKEEKKDGEQAADGGQAAACGKDQADAARPGAAAAPAPEGEPVSFLTDGRMLGLTAYYQRKMRETLRGMEERIATNQAAGGIAATQSGQESAMKN